MSSPILPRYPIFVPSKGRFENTLTAKFLERDGVPFRLVVEPGEANEYASRYSNVELAVLPEDGFGLLRARNWIRDLAESEGHARHWQIDDNVLEVRRWYRGERIPCNSGPAIASVEDFADRYENVGIAGLNYQMFGVGQSSGNPNPDVPPFYLNVHVYSFTLIDHAMPYRWRRAYNDDTDLCLQALAGGWCTVLVNVFLANKLRTMVMSGGNTDDLYGSEYDGRLKMARSLERDWPGVVSVSRRFQRPQHVVRGSWAGFDTPLRRRQDAEIPTEPNEYGLELRATRPPKSQRMRRLLDEANDR